MKKINILILAFITIIPFIARSQNEGVKMNANPASNGSNSSMTSPSQDMALIKDPGTAGGINSTSALYFQANGIYLEPGWVNGEVILKDQNVMDNIPLRYDIYHQQIQFVKGDDTLAFSKPDEVSYFMLEGKKFVYADYLENGANKKGYFEILIDDPCKLMLRRTIKYHKDADSEPNLKEDVYVREHQYFIKKPGDLPSHVIINRKGVLNNFKDKEDKVQEFIDSNKLKMNTIDDLREVVGYYNTLL